MDMQLEKLLLESTLRYENRRSALLLGLFGKDMPTIQDNLQQYDDKHRVEVDKACQNIQQIFQR